MNLIYAIDTAIEDLDESKSDIKLRAKITRFLNRGYKELAKREGKEVPNDLVNDEDKFITYSKNDEFILSYAKWLYYLADQDTDNAGIYKNEYEGFKLYAPKDFIKTVDVYGGDLNV